MSQSLSKQDRRTVLETLREFRAAPPPRDWAGPGCAMAIPGLALLRAATLLLCNAYATYGPSTVEAFDFGAARARLGARLDLVASVEDVLLGEGGIYPVFAPEVGDEEAHPS